jgi:hypothetical protein
VDPADSGDDGYVLRVVRRIGNHAAFHRVPQARRVATRVLAGRRIGAASVRLHRLDTAILDESRNIPLSG